MACPPVVTLRALPRAPRLTLGCHVLDGLLRGGVLTGGITEVVGEATAGKTQLTLRLLLTAQLSSSAGGLGGASLYFWTEGGDPPLRRLAELAAHMPGVDAASFASRVYVDRSVDSPAALLAALKRAAPLFEVGDGGGSSQPPVRLIVIDSIAALFRDAGDADSGPASSAAAYGARTDALFTVAAVLKHIAHTHGCAVVVVNQVTDVVDVAPVHTAGLALASSGRAVAPALGLAWANCVTTRLFLARVAPVGSTPRDGDTSVPRCLQVVFAPHLPPAWVRARVTTAGVVGVSGQEDGAENQAPGLHLCSGVFAA